MGINIQALELGEGVPHNKHLIINYTSIAENLKKWAEALIADRDYEQTLCKIEEALKAVNKILSIDKNESKANELHMDVLYTYGTIYDRRRESDNAITILRKLLELPYGRYREIEYHDRGVLLMANILYKLGRFNDARELLHKEERNIRCISKTVIIDRYKKIREKIESEERRKSGKIIRYNKERKYVIIESINSSGLTYLTFLSAFKEYVQLTDDILVREVCFIASEEGEKRYVTHVTFICLKVNWLQNGYGNSENTEKINVYRKHENRKPRKHAICHTRLFQPNP